MSGKKGYIKLSWQGIHDEYIIEYSTDRQKWHHLATVNSTTYTHTNLDPDTLYHYRVWGIKKGVKSSIPAQISGYPKDTTPPSPPSIAEITPIDRGIFLKLNPCHDKDFDKFQVHISTSPNFTPSDTTLFAEGNITTFTIPNLAPNTLYYIKVLAYDKSGNYSSSGEYQAVPKPPSSFIYLVSSVFSTSSVTYIEVPNTRFTYDSRIFSSDARWGAIVRATRNGSFSCTAILALWDITDNIEVATISFADVEGTPPPIEDGYIERNVSLTNFHTYCLKLKIDHTSFGTGYVYSSYIRFI